MAFIRIRTIGNHQYRYLEERYREDGKVRSRSTYLGRILMALAPVPPEKRGLRYIERLMEKYPAPPADKAATKLVETVKERFTKDTGLALPETPKAPTPVEKASPEAQSPSQSSDSSASPEADE